MGSKERDPIASAGTRSVRSVSVTVCAETISIQSHRIKFIEAMCNGTHLAQTISVLKGPPRWFCLVLLPSTNRGIAEVEENRPISRGLGMFIAIAPTGSRPNGSEEAIPGKCRTECLYSTGSSVDSCQFNRGKGIHLTAALLHMSNN
jgi:hypothetical protein